MSTQKSLFIAQAGGPTSVINASLAGIVKEAQQMGITHIYGLLHGLEGALKNDVIDFNRLSPLQLEHLTVTPGSFLGGSRYPLKEADFSKVVDFLHQENCQCMIMIGGNGTMDTGFKMHQMVQEKGYNIDIVGVPKTVDNDLQHIDFSPGYPSAAQYVALAVRDQIHDLASMKVFEQVRIIETMGRQVGWLAAAGFMAYHPTTTVNPLFIPEELLDESTFLNCVEKAYKQQGFAVAVIGEGMRSINGDQMGAKPFNGMADGGVHSVFTGASNYLADLVTRSLGLRARAQNLGMNQRACQHCVSALDRSRAFQLGQAGMKLALDGGGGNMVTMTTVNGDVRTRAVPLDQVAGVERTLPDHYYDRVNKRVTQHFVDWLTPLINDITPTLNPDEIDKFRR